MFSTCSNNRRPTRGFAKSSALFEFLLFKRPFICRHTYHKSGNDVGLHWKCLNCHLAKIKAYMQVTLLVTNILSKENVYSLKRHLLCPLNNIRSKSEKPLPCVLFQETLADLIIIKCLQYMYPFFAQ